MSDAGIPWRRGRSTTRRASARLGRRALTLAIAGGGVLSCTDATDVELLEITASGTVVGEAFLDLDGSGDAGPADEPLAGADVVLTGAAGAEPVAAATTDSTGAFTLSSVPLGSYRLTFASSFLGDSLVVLDGGEPVTVRHEETVATLVGASFESVSLEEALSAPVGRRLFTSGIALNARVNFGDGQVHFAGETRYLRGLNVERGAVVPGDSVRLLGRVVSDNGRPALDDVSFTVLVQAAQLVPIEEVTTGEAAVADGGALDAALVTIRNAEISDTSTTAEGHFRFMADDGTNAVEVMIRDFLIPTFNTSIFRPDTIVRLGRATGLLSPVEDAPGSVRWRLLPRAGADLPPPVVKLANTSVGTFFTPAAAALGDRVEISVVVSNDGPDTATGVQVSDDVAAQLAFVSATATAGSYDEAQGLWTVGDIPAAGSDTLRIVVDVIDDTGPTVQNVANLLPLLLQVDLTPGNNTASAELTIS